MQICSKAVYVVPVESRDSFPLASYISAYALAAVTPLCRMPFPASVLPLVSLSSLMKELSTLM